MQPVKDWKRKGVRVTGSTCDFSLRSEREKPMLTVSSLFNGRLNFLVNQQTNRVKLTMEYSAENFSFIGIVSMNVGPIYSTTKGAMNQLTKNLACEWAKDNIRGNSIAPWHIMTPQAEPSVSNEKSHDEVIARTPLGHIGEPRRCHHWWSSCACRQPLT
ncbi:tropinone reductase homolog At2g29290-like [Eucalyptus grandis]|uniref:tropinone reductase homolog At2g29290-like n=1 Tax=Eucalyptus grandis TaxID=71139 RepID=UPI00192EFFEA|nr:tropinone reductase homolog At2g29290-like [Eucalyptus grandis]